MVRFHTIDIYCRKAESQLLFVFAKSLSDRWKSVSCKSPQTGICQ